MNRNLIDQLPADEKSIAEKISSAAELMKLSQSFEWNLETELMNVYKPKMQENRLSKFLSPVGWSVAVIAGVLLMSWLLRSLPPAIQPASAPTGIPEDRFESDLRQGNICSGSLALAHGFEVFLTDENKSEFQPIITDNTLDERRTFAWSADGEQLAVVSNTTRGGEIYITDPAGGSGRLLSASGAGYLRGAAWSPDGEQIVLWSSQNMTTLYVLSTLGHGLIEKQLDVMIVGTPQFAPDGRSIFFLGAGSNAAGLFTVSLEPAEPHLLLPFVQDENGFAFSPDGARLAYIEYRREQGEARLSVRELSTGEEEVLGTLPIPRNSGAALPKVSNLSWSSDGRFLVLDLKPPAGGRTIYLARGDGNGLVPIVESGYVPTISADGRCLAYISNKQVFVLDVEDIASDPTTATPLRLADLPAGRGIPAAELDKLQWRP